MAFGSVMQASRHMPQPLHSNSSITGLTMSSVRAPFTGQLAMQAPHSGPLYGRQATISILALASFGIGESFVSSVSSATISGFSAESVLSSGIVKALGVQTETQGQSSHR